MLRSPPSRRRGLKFCPHLLFCVLYTSPPSRRRGLKLLMTIGATIIETSPPSRRRGLKFLSLVGMHTLLIVASFAEAWIEIQRGACRVQSMTSPPSRRRGLKFILEWTIEPMRGRLLRGGVD